ATSAVIPPPEVAPARTSNALAKQTGHITIWLLSFSFRSKSFPSIRPDDRASLPRTFDTPRPTARLFLAARHPTAFHARGRSDGAEAARRFLERGDVSKPRAMTSRAAGRGR